jgi:hypothetical protein
MRHAHPIIVALAMLAPACGASAAEVREARRSLYDTEFAVAYARALDAVRELYPNLAEDPTRGKIATAWHEVKYARTDVDDPKSIQAQDRALGNDPTGRTQMTGPQSQAWKRQFVRFDVTVAGGRPWRIRVVGKASEVEPGSPVPVDLRGAATPPWLAGRTEALTVAIHKRLKKFAIQKVEEPEVKDDADEPAPIDVAAFGPIPAGAAQRVGGVRQALARRDVTALGGQVATDVTWSLGASPGRDAALAMWQADPAILEAMAKAIDAGCRGDDAEIVCPPAATETPGYVGWRLTVAKRTEGWVVSSFVQGD